MDNRLAVIYHYVYVSWFGVFVAIGIFAGIAVAVMLRGRQKKAFADKRIFLSDIYICTAISMPLALVGARLFYGVFSFSEFDSPIGLLRFSAGGYGLYGAFLGVLAGAWLTVKQFGVYSLGTLLDCLAVGGALTIAVGRFATVFTGSELGYEVGFRFMTVYDAMQSSYTFAVYQLDGVLETVIFFVSLWFFHYCMTRGKRERIGGKTAMVMLALHGAGQVLCDSMRADALKFPLNEFIKVSQIVGIVCCLAVLVCFFVLSVRRIGWKVRHFVILPLIPLLVALGVFGEYRVGSGNYISNHLIMLGGMLGLSVIAICLGLDTVGKDAGNDSAAAVIMDELTACE